MFNIRNNHKKSYNDISQDVKRQLQNSTSVEKYSRDPDLKKIKSFGPPPDHFEVYVYSTCGQKFNIYVDDFPNHPLDIYTLKDTLKRTIPRLGNQKKYFTKFVISSRWLNDDKSSGLGAPILLESDKTIILGQGASGIPQFTSEMYPQKIEEGIYTKAIYEMCKQAHKKSKNQGWSSAKKENLYLGGMKKYNIFFEGIGKQIYKKISSKNKTDIISEFGLEPYIINPSTNKRVEKSKEQVIKEVIKKIIDEIIDCASGKYINNELVTQGIHFYSDRTKINSVYKEILTTLSKQTIDYKYIEPAVKGIDVVPVKRPNPDKFDLRFIDNHNKNIKNNPKDEDKGVQQRTISFHERCEAIREEYPLLTNVTDLEFEKAVNEGRSLPDEDGTDVLFKHWLENSPGTNLYIPKKSDKQNPVAQ